MAARGRRVDAVAPPGFVSVMPRPHPYLIHDLGMNHGEDTGFYLAKGFSVVGVEASPPLAALLARKFAFDIAARHLTLLHCGVWQEAGSMPFYVNEDNDHWSSFDPHYGTREGTKFHVVEVPCVPLGAIFSGHGVPHYLKIDIEGADRHVLAGLRAQPVRPDFVSVEEYGQQAVHDLAACGYTRFQAVTQANKAWAIPPDPPREGRLVHRPFDGRDSGLFGEELPPDAWMPGDVFLDHFERHIRGADGTWHAGPDEWMDIHAGR